MVINKALNVWRLVPLKAGNVISVIISCLLKMLRYNQAIRKMIFYQGYYTFRFLDRLYLLAFRSFHP